VGIQSSRSKTESWPILPTSPREAGTLTFFGGGDAEIFESAEAIFAAIAKQWFYMGPGGSGVSMKLVVNTLLGVGMQAVAEALALGLTLDLPRDVLFDTLAKTRGRRSGLCREAGYCVATRFSGRIHHKFLDGSLTSDLSLLQQGIASPEPSHETRTARGPSTS
jgi:3-hydroxyisobutyrate dehydrogenase-like beta-hydroxyacid dehydrogenase